MQLIKLKNRNNELDSIEIGKTLNIINSSRLMKEPKRKHKWLVDNLLFTAGTSIWAGKQKVGKTTLIRQLSLAVARGDKFLDRNVRSGLVLYLALEEDRDEIKEHLCDMGSEGEENLLFHIGAIPGDPLEALKAFIEDVRPALVVVDTLIKFTKIKDLNNYSLVTEQLEPLTEVARNNDCHILFVHHMNKSSFKGQDQVLGSVAILGSMDTIATVTQNGADRFIETKQRYGRSLNKHLLKFDEKTRMYLLSSKVDKGDLF